MITGIPDYTDPIEQGVRCTCRTYYIVFVGGAGRFDESLCNAAQARAEAMGAQFVDARQTPFMTCVECGGVLDFTNEASLAVK